MAEALSQLPAVHPETQPELSVVFISGYTEKVVLQKGIVKPDVVLLKKPFSNTELASALARVRAQRLRAG